ncbi:hypothetical protein ABFV05_020218 [Capra hircus]
MEKRERNEQPIAAPAAEGAAPKRRAGRLSTKRAPAKVETKPKKAAGKDESSDRKVQTKEKRGAKGKQVEVATQETKDLPASNGETEKIKKSRQLGFPEWMTWAFWLCEIPLPTQQEKNIKWGSRK